MSAYHPPLGPLRILYADEELLAVDKPPGLLSVPGKGPELAECLLSRLTALDPAVRLVHRLDRDTSGVMIFARTPAAQRHLGLQFERRHIQKTYVALLSAPLPEPEGCIDLPLIADWPNRPRQKVDHVLGKPARTRWSDLQETPQGAFRVTLFPETGRSHQIRVHMCELGAPILGDPLYGAVSAPRMMLHASALELRKPSGGEKLLITAPPGF